jgi:hypothetical protein
MDEHVTDRKDWRDVVNMSDANTIGVANVVVRTLM